MLGIQKRYERIIRMEKKKFKINIVDIIIVVIVIAACAIGYSLTHKESVVETKNIRYTVEFIDNPIGFGENIHEGDEITDNIKNYYMGKVVSVESVPYKKLIEDKEEVMWKESEIEGRETEIVTLEAPVTESGSDFKVNGYYTVKAGLEVAAKGPGYAGRGYILTVER